MREIEVRRWHPTLPDRILGSGATDANVKIAHYQQLLSQIPQLNKNILREVFSLLKVVAHFSATNKMHPDNLAIIFIPALKIDAANLFHDFFNFQAQLF